MLVIYSSREEVIVCEAAKEETTVKEFFTEGGRDLEDYDRDTAKNTSGILINSHPRVDFTD